MAVKHVFQYAHVSWQLFYFFFSQVFIFPRDLSPLKIFPSVYLPRRSKLLQLDTVLDKMGALYVNGSILGQAFKMTLPDPSRVMSGQGGMPMMSDLI